MLARQLMFIRVISVKDLAMPTFFVVVVNPIPPFYYLLKSHIISIFPCFANFIVLYYELL